MNRLIIIGNGFDLAHGYKTSYTDFILSYLKKSCIEAVNYNGSYTNINRNTRVDDRNSYEDSLLNIKLKTKYNNVNYENFINGCNNLKELFDFMQRYGFIKNFKSSFIKETIQHCEKLNWVDIENQYFQQILFIKQNYDRNKEKNQKDLIDLNTQMDFLSLKLEEYLSSLNIEEDNVEDSRLSNIFLSSIKKEEVVLLDLPENIHPKNIYFLNFNYTSTVCRYSNSVSKTLPSQINYIHGELNNEENQIVFGFGDEIDKSYHEIEELNENEYFKHIKSFKYFKTSKYHDLIRFTESAHYQIYIMGHSCGLSDRTLLNQVFEHENCKSIKIFYYTRPDGTNDFIDKTFEISRHFKNKGIMRKKIVPFEKSSSISKVTLIDKSNYITELSQI